MKARGTVMSRRQATAAAVSDWRSLKAGDRVEILKHDSWAATAVYRSATRRAL